MSQNATPATGRYQGLILSMSLFMALIFVLLAFTFYASNVLERNSTLANATHWVANDTQSLIKDIFDMQLSYGEDITSPHMKTVLTRLDATSKSIDATLTAIENAGIYHDLHGDAHQLPKVTDESAIAQLKAAQEQWNALKPRVDVYLAVASDITADSSTPLRLVGEQAKISSLAMNDALHDLTSDVTNIAETQARNIRIIQLVGVGAILAYFAVFILIVLRRLRESDAKTEAARQETAEIMQTVNTGLFLLDRDLNIGQQHSKALSDIIGTNRLGGENLTTVLRNRISDKDLDTTQKFIDQLYNPRVKEKLVDSLNPLNKVMIQRESEDGTSENRYLDFKFSRVYEGKDIARILVNVNDISDAVRLEQRLEQERAQNDMQIEMLATILNVNPTVVSEFIDNTHKHIEKMNNTLKNPGNSQFELQNKTKSLYREMHSLKGEASALKLHSFTRIASEAENKLHALQNQATLSGNDFLPLTVHLDELLSLSNTIAGLGERINAAARNMMSHGCQEVSARVQEDYLRSEMTQVAKEEAVDAKEELVEYLEQFAQDIAERQGKLVQLDTQGLEGQQIPARLKTVTKELCVQLLRNAIVHGIGSPTARVQNGKNEMGTVKVTVQSYAGDNKSDFIFSMEDDGRGIDYEAIRQRIIAKGTYTEDEVYAFEKSRLLNTLFSSGFSTKDQTDEDAGRGVGLDIVKDRVKEFGGKINVQSEDGQFCRFVIKLPM
ncbi:ATP-binding protein [Moraxella bovis]|uniref:Chemotaxis protein CheA n=1 Tax=Moraxella bovis TaxID=476 RepID=A0A378PRS0_MORBO|nr:ATP-binding protein [Moraxella bovis]STY91258.1 Chemotaxis protein CheA [Moraxella bovis]